MTDMKQKGGANVMGSHQDRCVVRLKRDMNNIEAIGLPVQAVGFAENNHVQSSTEEYIPPNPSKYKTR